MPDGPNKGTLVTFNVRKFNEEDYLQVLWEMEDHIALTHNFYLNSKDPKKKKMAHEKLNNLLLWVGVPEDIVKKGGFSDYDSIRMKRAYVFKKSFKNDAGEFITYIEKYAPLEEGSCAYKEHAPIEDTILF